MTLNIEHVQWNHYQTSALFVVSAVPHRLFSPFFRMPKCSCKFADELQRDCSFIMKLCNEVDRVWCSRCGIVFPISHRGRSACQDHINSAKHKASGLAVASSSTVHFSKVVTLWTKNLILQLSKQPLCTTQPRMIRVLILQIVVQNWFHSYLMWSVIYPGSTGYLSHLPVTERIHEMFQGLTCYLCSQE